MNQFQKVTKNIDTLAEFLSSEKDSNSGCGGCDSHDVCVGKETCKKIWEDFLSSEAED